MEDVEVYWVDPTITSLIEAMYDNVEYAVIINDQLTEWFRVEIGVTQGCLLSSILFILFLEFVMTDLKSLCKKFKLDTNLTFDFRYADDTMIMSTMSKKLQISTKELAGCRKCCIKINFSKCKIITSSDKRITLEGKELKTLSEFCFLGSILQKGREIERC